MYNTRLQTVTYLCYSDTDIFSQMQGSLHFLLGLGYIMVAELHPLLRGRRTATIKLAAMLVILPTEQEGPTPEGSITTNQMFHCKYPNRISQKSQNTVTACLIHENYSFI